MNDDQKKQVYADLKACLDLAVHISPLVLLHAVPGSRFNMDRGSLVKVSLHRTLSACAKTYGACFVVGDGAWAETGFYPKR